jgi:hypothetical protein
MILTIKRLIWKSERKCHINLEQQAVKEVKRSAARGTGFTFNRLSGCGR